MKSYLVGGHVRDKLLGQASSDSDWVVVGATPGQMLDQGFIPIGRDFPVFLHPKTHQEYALARTERKSAPGYRGFVVHAAPDVSLEDDLARRDLTINAMAQDEQGRLIDPYGGQRDLQNRVLRHVTDAFREDPVRILRLARFAACFSDFEVAPETMALARYMVAAGEVDALVPERVWQEVARGLQGGQSVSGWRPSRMAQVLYDCGAWSRLWPELSHGIPERIQALARIDDQTGGLVLAQRWALWCHLASPEQVRDIGRRYRVPTTVCDHAHAWARHRQALQQWPNSAKDAHRLLQLMQASRHRSRIAALIDLTQVCSSNAVDTRPAQLWRQALQAFLQVDSQTVTRQALAQGLSGPDVGRALAQAQIEAIAVAPGFTSTKR